MTFKKIFFTALFFLFFSIDFLFSQTDSLVLSKTECEVIFLKNNLHLLVENINISKAEAEVIQAKVWPNPTLTIDEVNLWKSEKHFGNEEIIPPLFGNIGRNQQFNVGFEQLIITAGKRKKFIELKKIGVEQHKQYFEEVLRSLKIEFRALLHQLDYLQAYTSVYEKQLSSINQLTQSYKNQVDKGFIEKGAYIRLKATALEIQSNLNQLENELHETEHNVKLLMNLPITSQLKLVSDRNLNIYNQFYELSIGALIDTARNNRPEFKGSKLIEDYAHQSLAIERAGRVPDFSLIGNYDRGDGIYPNYVSFGISLDLPVFNRNKGNIRIAGLEIEQAKINHEFITKSVEKEVSLAVLQYRKSLGFMSQLDKEYENNLDLILNAYTENFKNKNINLIEYLDFLNAYLENKNIILQAIADLKNKAEKLNYVVGKDIIK